MRPHLLFLVYALPCSLSAQQITDTTRVLREVVVEAYETDRQLNEVPASIAILKPEHFQRFSNTSLLPAVNLVPGVRMEERSPGSFRFSIRGSSLRSPFGVRNVKVYWNGLPFTDGGGNTYLNLLDFSAVGSMEIIKGPGGSLYGAGTGGVILLKSPDIEGTQLRATAVAGSYGLQRYLLGGQFRNQTTQANVQVARHQSEGYREQTELERTSVHADLRMVAGSKGTLSATLLYADLAYGTPGGLTLTEMLEDPRQARPPTALPGAVEARAAVTNETIFGGLTYAYDWSSRWTTTAGVYGGFSDFENPTIRNYEDRDETNIGARTKTEYTYYDNRNATQKITFGAELQHFTSPIAVYDNDGAGNPAAIQVKDEVTSDMGLVFAQADFELPSGFFVTAGASVNFLNYSFVRRQPSPVLEQDRQFDAVLSPRLALLKKFSNQLSLFASYSDGFSPPSLAEVRPSTNTFSNTLKAEKGNNLEIGGRGNLFDTRLNYEVVVYDFSLRNTIVVQRNSEGADYFVNAGKTSQRGIEVFASWELPGADEDRAPLAVWASYAYQHFRFKDYAPLDADYSGNALTGVAPTIFSAGADLFFLRQFSAHLTANYVDHIPLNDANTAFADAYFLAGLRAAWTGTFDASRVELFTGVDNAFDAQYSLGNDLNAFGGRYYNPAMPRNFYAGISLQFGKN